MSEFGLEKKHLSMICHAISGFPEIEDVHFFGSRAMGNYKNGSDIDLAVRGSKVTHESVLRLRSILEEEMPLPYRFDVLLYDDDLNPDLKKHIDQHGVLIYSKPRL